MKGVTLRSTSTSRDNNEKLTTTGFALRKAQPQLWWGLFAVTLITGTVLTFFQVRSNLNLPDGTLPTLAELNRGVTIYDCHDKYVCTLRAEADRQAVPLDKISKNMRDAIISAEDRRFYEHHGVDPIGIARACWRNHAAGRIVEGGSTITQQLVKNLFLDPKERSYTRKVKEAFIAWDVNSRYSKAKILETYLNVAYFGGGVCGVERAAQHYFNKHASQLDVAESAYLAGLVKAPTDLTKSKNKRIALQRQQDVIAKMAEYGYLTPDAKRRALSEKLAFERGPLSRPWPHYIGCVEQELKRELGEDLWKKGWKVYTNLDVNAQKLAEATINKGIKTAPKGIDQGALVSMSVKDGSVFAIVGGAGNYEDVQWNRAINPHTAGSSFKPFVYLAALNQGIIQPDTLINDAPLVIEQPPSKPYEPKNFDGRFKGWLPAKTALATSRNICAVRVAQAAGLPQVIEMARNAGVRSQLDAYPALALGCCAISPLDMATAYATIARGGTYMAPQFIRKIETEKGLEARVYKATPSANLPTEPTLQLLGALEDVVRCGTGTRARIPGVAVAGKTGTANDSKDIWFVGTTPDIVTAVWAGNDKHKAVRGTRVTGGVVMAKIWHDYMAPLLKSRKPETVAFAKPAIELQSEVTKYADNQLFHESIDQTDDGFQYNSARLAAQVNNLGDLETIEQRGIARAYDLQKLQAVKRLRDSMIAKNDSIQNGYVQNGYNRTYQRTTYSTVSPSSNQARNTMIASSAQDGFQNGSDSNTTTTYATASNTILLEERSMPETVRRTRIVTQM